MGGAYVIPDEEAIGKVTTDACVLWDGATNQKGYGVTSYGELAHREVYRMRFGEIPVGHHVHHKCGTRDCVRPDHLAAVTPQRHNREHTPGQAIGDKVEALLAQWGPMRGTWAAHMLLLPTQQTLVALRRAAKVGTVRKTGRGVYGPLDEPQCPQCNTVWWPVSQWCHGCDAPKWVLLRDLIEANR